MSDYDDAMTEQPNDDQTKVTHTESTEVATGEGKLSATVETTAAEQGQDDPKPDDKTDSSD